MVYPYTYPSPFLDRIISALDYKVRKAIGPVADREWKNTDNRKWLPMVPEEDIQIYAFPQSIREEGSTYWNHVTVHVAPQGWAVVCFDGNLAYFLRKPNEKFFAALHNFDLPRTPESWKELDDEGNEEDQDRTRFLVAEGKSYWPPEQVDGADWEEYYQWGGGL